MKKKITADTISFGLCKHCGGNKAIRNPSGFCDHLYYPDNCKICSSKK